MVGLNLSTTAAMSAPFFEPVVAPILKSVAIKEVAPFKRERELCLAAVNERRAIHRADRVIEFETGCLHRARAVAKHLFIGD